MALKLYDGSEHIRMTCTQAIDLWLVKIIDYFHTNHLSQCYSLADNYR